MSGALPSDPATWPPRHALSQALGASEAVGPEVQWVDLRDGDRLLLCSDGLTDALTDGEIARIAAAEGEAPRISEELVAAASDRGARDNVTVVLVVF